MTNATNKVRTTIACLERDVTWFCEKRKAARTAANDANRAYHLADTYHRDSLEALTKAREALKLLGDLGL